MNRVMKGIYGGLVIAPAMVLLPLTATAAGLPVFGGWTVQNGVIDHTCPAGFNCTVEVGGIDGFAQISVSAPGQPTYIWTIITDPNANSADANFYRDESFVRQGADNGIMAQQMHQQTDETGAFTNTSTLMIGWANPTPDADNPNLLIEQNFTGAANDFLSSFDMLVIHDENGEAADRAITIDQRILFNDNEPIPDQQRFLLEQRQGAFTEAGSVTFAECQEQAGECTLSWLDEQEVMMRWIGQRLDLGGQGTSQFGFQGVTNLSAVPNQEITTFSLERTGINDGNGGTVPPFGWSETFGDTPPSL